MKSKLSDEILEKGYDVAETLHKNGKSDRECSYIKIMSEGLSFVLDSLERIRFTVFVILGLLIGHLLAGLL